jgi:hypothetical protein
MNSLFQDEKARGELIFPKSFQRQRPPKNIRFPGSSVNVTSYLSQWGWVQYANFLGILSGCIQGHMFMETNHSVREGTLLVTLLSNCSETCMLMQLVISFTLAFHNSTHWNCQQMPQYKKETPGVSFAYSRGIAEQLDGTSSRKRRSICHNCGTVLYSSFK